MNPETQMALFMKALYEKGKLSKVIFEYYWNNPDNMANENYTPVSLYDQLFKKEE